MNKERGNLATCSDKKFYAYCKQRGFELAMCVREFPVEERLAILRYMVRGGFESATIRRTLEEEEIYSTKV